MSKYKIGDKVWVQATFVDGTDDNPQVMIHGYCFADVRQQDGGLDILTLVSPKRLKPDVTFKWSPAKAKKKGSKK